MYALSYEGLKKKETYSEIIDYLMNKQEKIKMTSSLAKQLRNNLQLANIQDGAGEGVLDREEQQKKATIEIEREHRIREIANVDRGATERRAFQPRPRTRALKTAKVTRKSMIGVRTFSRTIYKKLLISSTTKPMVNPTK